MQYVRLLSLPKLKFAHVFGADKYDNVLKKNPEGFIEISYIKEGEMRKFHNGEWFCRREGDIFCNTFVRETRVSTDAWHEHHTVGFSVLMEYSPSEKAGFYHYPNTCPIPSNPNAPYNSSTKLLQKNKITVFHRSF